MVGAAELAYMVWYRKQTDQIAAMSGLFLILVPLSLLAVLVVLGLGLNNMARRGSPRRSQEFMRWRVILQLVALIVMMTALYFATR